MRQALIDAYVGYYEDTLRRKHRFNALGRDYSEWAVEEVHTIIRANSPHERLRIYLEWNGIIGFTETIYAIATGEV